MSAKGPEIGAGEATLSVSIGLSVGVASAEEPPDLQVPSTRHRSGQELRRIESPVPAVCPSAGHPCDEVGGRRDRGDGIGQLGDDRRGTPVLEVTDSIRRFTDMHERGHHHIEPGNNRCVRHDPETRNAVCHRAPGRRRPMLGIDQTDIVDETWADNGPGWIAVMLATCSTRSWP